MSSTNRGAERRPSDFYPTPAWCVRALLPVLRAMPAGHWCEPCVGDGDIVRTLIEEQVGGYRWTTNDIRPVPPLLPEHAHTTGDFRNLTGTFDVVITNPPFGGGAPLDLYRWARPRCRYLVMLTRLNWPVTRDELRGDMPDVYALPERPSFTGRGSDSADYAWLVWGPWKRRDGRFELLDRTPLDERRADHAEIRARLEGGA